MTHAKTEKKEGLDLVRDGLILLKNLAKALGFKREQSMSRMRADTGVLFTSTGRLHKVVQQKTGGGRF